MTPPRTSLRWTLSFCAIALTAGIGSLSLASMSAYGQTPAAPAQEPAHPDVPDAPLPQAPAPMSDVKNQVTPGLGSNSTPPAAQSPAEKAPASSGGDSDNPGASAPAPAVNAPERPQADAPNLPKPGEGFSDVSATIRVTTTAVEVPVTVKDSKGQLVAGLTWRDFRVYENNVPQQIRVFTTDPFPMSIAYIIDQSVTADVMSKVNNSLGAIQGALAPYDDVAVFSYNNGPQMITGFTGAQSNRLTAILEVNKAPGREEGVPVNSGPLAGCAITSNEGCVDPNLQQGRSAGGVAFMNIPKEKHTLNDAILMAAKELSTRPVGRRRIVYVISDGKEYGSKATTKEVIKYLQTNKIAVYATLVGDSARWGEGYLSRFHIPFQMNDNVLPKYTQATGGALDAERGTNGIEKSYQKLAEEARNQYTIVYYSHQPAIDGKYRSIEVRVDRPSKEIEVTAKPGYYPTAQDVR